jgi:hypothetical protein
MSLKVKGKKLDGLLTNIININIQNGSITKEQIPDKHKDKINEKSKKEKDKK